MFLPEIKSTLDEDISILIKVDNHHDFYLCECGDASGLTGSECQKIAAIFISHTHLDHFTNFDWILRHQLRTEKKVVICGPKNIARQVQAKIKAFTWNLIPHEILQYEIWEIRSENEIRLFRLLPIEWSLHQVGTITNGELYRNNRFQVKFAILDHRIDSIAYLFQEKDHTIIDLEGTGLTGGPWVRELKNAFENQLPQAPIEIDGKNHQAKDLFHLLNIKKGDTLGVIMDHAASPENHQKIKALFQGCNKVFIECFYRNEDEELARENFHSYAEKSGSIMRECGVGEAIPIHFSGKYKGEEINALIAEFESSFKNVVLK